MTENLKNPNVQ